MHNIKYHLIDCGLRYIDDDNDDDLLLKRISFNKIRNDLKNNNNGDNNKFVTKILI